MLARVLKTVPLDTIDRRSQAGVFLRRVRDDLTDQLGSPTPAERLLIHEAATSALIARVTGEYILSRNTLVRDGGAELLPVVLQREVVVGNLGRTLRLLGFHRRKEPAMTLDQYLAGKQGNSNP